MAFNLGFIGGGNMSTAIANGILKNENHPASKLWVAGPRLHNLQHWKDWGANLTTNSGELILQCDVVFIGVKPGVLNEVITDCLQTVKQTSKKVLFISMLVGITIEQLHKALKQLPVESSVIRILPNTPMAVGAGSCLYAVDSQIIIQDQCILLENLLHGCGVVEKIPENLMNHLGTLTGCGPAFIYMVIEALADGAVKLGVPRAMAIRHAAQMVAGSGQMVLQSGKHPGVLKDEVCSPAGCTISGVAALEDGKLRATLINALNAASPNAKEMGNK